MKTKRALFVYALIGGLASSAATAEERRSMVTSNEIAILEARSDWIGVVEVVGVQDVRPPAASNALNFTVLGRLVSLRVATNLFDRHMSTNESDHLYMFREGAVGGSRRDPKLKIGGTGIAFLRTSDVPSVVSSGISSEPRLPCGRYFSFSVLPDRNFPLRWGWIEAVDSNAVSAVVEFFSNRVVAAERE
jgi:hypothetical protein